MASGKLRDPDTVPQNLSNMAWALAVLGHEDRAFMGEVMAAAGGQLRHCSPQDLSNMAWALAKLCLHVDGGMSGSLVAPGVGDGSRSLGEQLDQPSSASPRSKGQPKAQAWAPSPTRPPCAWAAARPRLPAGTT